MVYSETTPNQRRIFVSTYAIPIEQNTLDLIQVLNGGVRPEIEEEHTWFVFEIDGPTDTTNHRIIDHDDLFEMSVKVVGHGYAIYMVK